MKKRVILVDDHELIREGLKLMLRTSQDFELMGEATGENSLRELLRQETPDIVVMDIILPGSVSGIELCRFVKKNYPRVKVLFLSANVGKHYIHAAVQEGANGFISKDCSASEFIHALQVVVSGREYFSQKITSELLQMFVNTRRVHGEEPVLSAREIDIVARIAEGMDFNTIGEALGISPRTVETHKRNILIKLQLDNTAELIKYAIRSQITSL
jgi:two-component system response regulator NreC